MARSMAMAGVRPGMLVHNADGHGLFTGGLGFHHGAERLGATIFPVSTGQTKRQVRLLCDLQAQVLCATPSYAVTIAEALEEEGIGPGGAMECEEGAGAHLNEDHFLVEVLDPDSAQPVAPGDVYPSEIEHVLLGVEGSGPTTS